MTGQVFRWMLLPLLMGTLGWQWELQPTGFVQGMLIHNTVHMQVIQWAGSMAPSAAPAA